MKIALLKDRQVLRPFGKGSYVWAPMCVANGRKVLTLIRNAYGKFSLYIDAMTYNSHNAALQQSGQGCYLNGHW
jgi:hypothetical protein